MVRGDNMNNIIVSGFNGVLSHFNGYSWNSYFDKGIPPFSGRLNTVKIKNNLAVTAGYKERSTIIIMDKR